jgi:hypothetical protein
MPSVRTLGDASGLAVRGRASSGLRLSDEARPDRYVEVGRGYTDAKKIADLVCKGK